MNLSLYKQAIVPIKLHCFQIFSKANLTPFARLLLKQALTINVELFIEMYYFGFLPALSPFRRCFELIRNKTVVRFRIRTKSFHVE